MPLLLPVIMCGGAGTRMWPESRESLPKQFLRLLSERSMFQTTVGMFAQSPAFSRPLIVSNKDYRFLIDDQLKEIGVEAEVVLEPTRRDSAAAVAVATELAMQRDPETIVLVMAADHNVEDRPALLNLIGQAAAVARAGFIVTFGVRPSFPATGYGYIKPGRALEGGAFEVALFVEKPNIDTARRYLEDGYLWNSGNFIFSAKTMHGELLEFEPAIAAAAAGAISDAARDHDSLLLDADKFASAPKKSIDYAIMERTRRAAVMPAAVGWSDVGTWTSVRDLSPCDEDGNAIRGHGVVLNGSRVLVRSDEKMTVVVGLDDVIVVTTHDAVLVLDAEHADKVKQVVQRLQDERRPETRKHKHKLIYRPWGHYQSIDDGDRHQIKRILIKPEGRLTLSPHPRRVAHWIVVRGAVEVEMNGSLTLVQENEAINLPIGAACRLANPGGADIELIGVQTGSDRNAQDSARLDEIFELD